MMYNYKGYKPKIHETCFLAPGCSVIGRVSIGEKSSVWHNAVIRGDEADINIGDNTNIQDGCVLHCTKDAEISIGNGVTIGHGVILHSCSIQDDCLVGMGAIVLDGAKIGKNCLVGAGAVVTPRTEIPDRSLVVGNPAKIKRVLTQEEIKYIKENAKEYVEFAGEYEVYRYDYTKGN